LAKQRRPTARPGKVRGSEAEPSRPATPAVQASRPAPPGAPARRTTYFEAVALYERGLEALQRHDFRAASELFESVLRQYPDEKELHERVRLYLNICQRQRESHDAKPQTIEERLYAATLAINGGQYDRAISELRLVRDEDPDNDHALYMLAVAHAQRGELAEATAHLERAITLNPENRSLARTDPDLEPLRGNEAFRTALEVPLPSRPGSAPFDRRRPIRPRTGR
jgi:tetratricopeptide (TPR) repeat protein